MRRIMVFVIAAVIVAGIPATASARGNGQCAQGFGYKLVAPSKSLSHRTTPLRFANFVPAPNSVNASADRLNYIWGTGDSPRGGQYVLLCGQALPSAPLGQVAWWWLLVAGFGAVGAYIALRSAARLYVAGGYGEEPLP